MENFNFEMNPGVKNNSIESGSKSENKIELTGPNLRIFNLTKKDLGMLFGFGLRSVESDPELMEEINRHFLENDGVMGNKIREWETALSDVNRDAEMVEGALARNFANTIYSFITNESKIRNKYNN